MSLEITNRMQKLNLSNSEIRHDYITKYKNDPDMILMGVEVESDDEYSVISVRHENRYKLLRVRRDK